MFEFTSTAADQAEVEAWHSRECDALRTKADEAKARADTASDKAAEWQEMELKRKRRKAVSSTRNSFKKPHRLYIDLLEQGDDFLRGVGEELRPYRLKRLIDSYAKTLGRLNMALSECRELLEMYPSISEQAGGFDWVIEIPELTNENGKFMIQTSTGITEATIHS